MACAAFVALLLLSMAAPAVRADDGAVASIYTDKEDYSPGETVLIFGVDFLPDETVTVTVTRPDGEEHTWDTFSNETGAFETSYELNGILGNYTVDATDGTNTATTTFTDAIQVNWVQCRNDVNDDGVVDTPMCTWVTGAQNPQNSLITEGNVPPPYPPAVPGHVNYRAIFEDLVAGTYELTIKYEFTRGGKVAFDFLTTDYGVSNTNRCTDLPSGVTTASCNALVSAGPSTQAFPFDFETLASARGGGDVEDRQVAHDAALAGHSPRTMKIYGATISSITNLARTGPESGNSEDRVKITFVKTTGGSSHVIASWGGHLGIGAAHPVGYLAGNGAGSISGANFHMTLDVLGRTTAPVETNVLTGSRDRAVQVSTVVLQRITIVKDAIPNHAQDFQFSGSGPIGTFFLDDDATDTTLPSSLSFFVAAGTYTVTEVVPSGWVLTSISCSDPDGGTTTSGATATIDLDSGEHVICTFTNSQKATLTIAKNAIPDDEQDFEFASSFGDNFFLDDDPGSATPSSMDFELAPGVYSVSEVNLPSNWDLTGSSCTDGSPVGAIDLSPGETVTCTFTNTKRGQIVIVKTTLGGNTEFSFTGDLGGFSITTSANTGSETFDDLVSGTYFVTETVPSLWDLTAISCSDPTGDSSGSLDTNTATIVLGAGESVTCTFTNRERGTIIIVKQTEGGDGAFDFDGGLGEFSIATSGGSGSETFGNLVPGTYAVTEIVPAGWDLTASSCDDGSSPGSISLAPGETVTCTFTNVKRGKVIINKQTVGVASGDFDFTGDLGDFSIGVTGSTGSETFDNLLPGTYDVTESDQEGWDLTGLSCDDPTDDSTTAGSTATIALGPGETVSCTFVNTKRGNIVIVKVAVGGDGTFSFTGDLGAFSIGTTSGSGDEEFLNLIPGTYAVSETGQTGWDLTSSSCDDGSDPSEIDLNPGETVTCTFTNTKRGKIVVVKETIGGDGTFAFTGGLGSFSIQTSTGSGTEEFENVIPGTITVTETGQTGWDLTGLSCVDPTGGTTTSGATATIALAPGETVTCTFENTKRGTIIVVKETIGGDGTFSFTGDLGGFSLTTSGGPASETFPNLLPFASYDVSESVPTGWDLTGLACTESSSVDATPVAMGGVGTATVTLSPGDVITCTFEDTKRGTVTILKHTVGGDGQFTFGLTGSGTVFETVTTSSGSGQVTFANVLPGTHTATESVPPNWVLISVSCNDSDSTGDVPSRSATVVVAPGETVTCTFTNFRPSRVTDSQLCAFDRDPNVAGRQFRLIFTQDPTSPSTYKQTASNPGQFFYNVFLNEAPGTEVTVELTIPFPFVTQGANPIHVYDDVTYANDCFFPGAEITSDFTIATKTIVLSDYGSDPSFSTQVVRTITGPAPASGVVYVNIHLDYGLKKTVSWEKGTSDTAMHPTWPDIPNGQAYTFGCNFSGCDQTVESQNAFKRNPGFGGLVVDGALNSVSGVTVQIYRPDNTLLGTATTDADGVYHYAFKHTGKPADYKVKLPGYGQEKTVTVKANSFVWVDFTV